MVRKRDLFEVLDSNLNQKRFQVQQPIIDAAFIHVVHHGSTHLFCVNEIKMAQYGNEAFKKVCVLNAIFQALRPCDVLDIMHDFEHLVVRCIVVRRCFEILDCAPQLGQYIVAEVSILKDQNGHFIRSEDLHTNR